MGKEVRTVARPSTVVYKVNGLPPALMEYLVPFAVNSRDTDSMPSRNRAVQPTPTHQRSIVEDIYPYDALEFGGQLFGDLSAKGAFEDNIVVEWNENSGFHINGLVALRPETLSRRTTTMEQVVFAQDGSAEDTEVTILVYKPEKIRFRGEDASQTRLKQLLLEDIGRQEPDDSNEDTWVPANKTQLTQAEEYLDGVDFYQVFRLQPMGIRLSDIATKCDSQAEFLQRMAEVFRFVNTRELWRQRRDPTYVAKFWYLDKDYERQGKYFQFNPEVNEMTSTYEDLDISHIDSETQRRIDDFFVEYATRVYGQELGILHGKGVLHANLHSANVFPTGEFGDLDTAKGRAFGENIRYLYFDIDTSIESDYGFLDTIRKMQRKGFLSPSRFLRVKLMENFFDAYLAGRYGGTWLFGDEGLEKITNSGLERSALTNFQLGTLGALANALETTLARNGIPTGLLTYNPIASTGDLFTEFIERRVNYAERQIGLAKAQAQPEDDRKEIVYRALGNSFYSIGMIKAFISYVEEQIASNLVLPDGSDGLDKLFLIYTRIEAYKLVNSLFTYRERSLRRQVEHLREELLLQAT